MPSNQVTYILRKFQKEKREKEKLFKEIIAENFPCFVKYMKYIGIQEAQPTSNLINSKRSPLEHNIIKTLRARERENFESSKRQVSCHTQMIPRKITSRFLIRNLKGRRKWVDIFKMLKKEFYQPRILYLENCPST